MPQRRDIIAEFGLNREELEREFQQALQGVESEEIEKRLDESVRDFSVDTVLEGVVVDFNDDEVMLDIGYKSEGVVPRYEWEGEEVEVGDKVEVLLEAVEGDSGIVQLSKEKADQLRAWQKISENVLEGDIVTGEVTRKIKGGLLIDIGVPVFLPASQVDIRRPGEIADYIGMQLTCKVLKIDYDRHNIVLSRRQLIEEQRALMQKRLFPTLEEGEIRSGKVKNIVDFGAFVDLGGIDGLLHITDMSWGRISHPSEIVAIDDEIEVKVLSVDEEERKVALGLKQKTPSPWEDIEEKYPVGSTASGEVVNLMNYGAFVKMEEGVEGLVHISEMSWTRRINHPSEMVSIGDVVDVVVLDVDPEKEQVSLGIKQTEKNPWEVIGENYPPGSRIVGKVRNITSYGAFIEIEDGIDGLLHINDMSWTRKVNHPSEVVQKGESVECMVLEVDPGKRRVALGLKQLEPDPWEEEIPSKYRSGDIARGRIAKLTSFGAFVELEDGLEGLLHISEMTEKDIDSPEEIVAEGDVVDVRVLRVNREERRIGLSLLPEAGAEEDEKPQLVLMKDEIEESEKPEDVVEEVLEEAPQHKRAEERQKEEEGPEENEDEAAPAEGLNIPKEVVSDMQSSNAEEEESEGEADAEDAPSGPDEEDEGTSEAEQEQPEEESAEEPQAEEEDQEQQEE